MVTLPHFHKSKMWERCGERCEKVYGVRVEGVGKCVGGGKERCG